MARAERIADLEQELAALEAMPLAELRERWCKLTDRSVPRVSAALLRLALAWELQVRVYGGLSRQALQTLDQLAAGRTETGRAQPGMRLMREWNGTIHVVTIESSGAIFWDGTTWPSLSRVAREITGTRWSGPAFFGLKQKRQAA